MTIDIRFGIDLDGVLGNFTAEVITAANSLWPNKTPLDYIPENWDYQGILTPEEWKQVWAKLMDTENLWLKEQDLQGVYDLQKFVDKYPLAQIYFITARAQTKGMSVLVQSTRWLEQRGLWSRFNRSTVIPVEHSQDKLEVIRELKLPFFLDDHAPTISALQQIPNMEAYVLDEPHNRHAEFLPRVSSVKEYLKIIEERFE